MRGELASIGWETRPAGGLYPRLIILLIYTTSLLKSHRELLTVYVSTT